MQEHENIAKSCRPFSTLLQADLKINKLILELYPSITSNQTELPKQTVTQNSEGIHLKISPSNCLNLHLASEKPHNTRGANRLKTHTERSRNFSAEKEMRNQIIENRICLNNAKRQFEDRLREKSFRNYHKRMKSDGSGTEEGYKKLYERFRSEAEDLNINNQLQEDEKVIEGGVQLFKELRDRPAILDYTRMKIENQRKKKQGKKLVKRIEIEQSIKDLIKKRKTHLSKVMLGTSADWSKGLEKSNVEEVNGRLKKIFSKKSPEKVSEEKIKVIEKSQVWRNQKLILQQLNETQYCEKSKKYKFSKEGKEKLLLKFGQILNQFGKSVRSTIFMKTQSHKTPFAFEVQSSHQTIGNHHPKIIVSQEGHEKGNRFRRSLDINKSIYESRMRNTGLQGKLLSFSLPKK